MPSATRRRNRLASESSEGSAEEAGPSQPLRRSQTNQAASTTSNSSFDPFSSLTAQPLTRAQIPNVKQLISDLRIQDTNLSRAIELLNDTADQLAEAFRTHDDCPELDQAELDLRELIDTQAEKAARKTVLEAIVRDLAAGVTIEDPTTRYKTEVQIALDTYNKQTSRQKYSRNDDFENFKNSIWVARNEGPMPPVRDLIPSESGDDNDDDDDDDVQIGGTTQNFRCPLTSNLFEDPVTNSNCKHSYSKLAIEQYLSLGKTQCPSCTGLVSKSMIKPDQKLAKQVAAFKRREEEKLLARRQTSTILY